MAMVNMYNASRRKITCTFSIIRFKSRDSTIWWKNRDIITIIVKTYNQLSRLHSIELNVIIIINGPAYDRECFDYIIVWYKMENQIIIYKYKLKINLEKKLNILITKHKHYKIP